MKQDNNTQPGKKISERHKAANWWNKRDAKDACELRDKYFPGIPITQIRIAQMECMWAHETNREQPQPANNTGTPPFNQKDFENTFANTGEGEWIKQDAIIYIKDGFVNIYAYPIIEKNYPVCYVLINSSVTTKQAEANAARIVLCWNQHEQLLEENKALKENNRELIEALREAITGWDIEADEDGNLKEPEYQAFLKCNNVLIKHTK